MSKKRPDRWVSIKNKESKMFKSIIKLEQEKSWEFFVLFHQTLQSCAITATTTTTTTTSICQEHGMKENQRALAVNVCRDIEEK